MRLTGFNVPVITISSSVVSSLKLKSKIIVVVSVGEAEHEKAHKDTNKFLGTSNASFANRFQVFAWFTRGHLSGILSLSVFIVV
jgi:hypothetical protein